MPGLVNYTASPTPSPPPSTKRGEQGNEPSKRSSTESVSTSSKAPRKTPVIRKVPKVATMYTSSNPATPPAPAPSVKTSSKRRRTSPSPSGPSSSDLPQNLTHTAQSALPSSVLAAEPITLAEEAGEAQGWPGYPGMSDEEVFKIVTRPEEISGTEDWGIPGEVDPEECSEELKTKVANFLKLKSERGEHINTRLLSSAAFANPYIYTKLVDFVQIDEHATQFPSSGWLTRRNIEAEVPVFGPAALGLQQKAKQEATRKAQEVGKRKEIAFKSGGKESYSSQSESRGATGSAKWESGRNNGNRAGDGDRARARDKDRNGKRDGYRG